MNQSIQWLLILIGLAATVVLVLFITRQLQTLRHARQAQQERDERWNRQKHHLTESVQVLARSMLANQMELSEGCIRIKVLLDSLAPDLNQDPRFHVFQQMYESLEHMPTHEARQQTDQRFVRKMDHQRFRLEREHQAAILEASRELLKVDFSAPGKAARRPG